MSDYIPSLKQAKDQRISAENLCIRIISCEFNQPVVEGLLWGARQAFLELGGGSNRLIIEVVPGAVEVPLKAQTLLQQSHSQASRIDGIVALGAVIKGESDHYEHVCRLTADGIMRVMLDFSTPIGFGIVMTESEQLALNRAAKNAHNKGLEAMLAVIKMAHQQRSHRSGSCPNSF